MNKLLLALCFSIFVANLPAQCPVGFVFERQSQIDSFPILYPNCTNFPAGMTISGADITNVLGLANLKSIDYLTIQFNNKLNDLSGLDQVDTIRTGFVLNVNNNLFSLHGLEQLRYIGGSFYMNNNDDLQNLLGLSNLQTVKGNFSIIGNSLLKNLKGLDQLYEAGELFISNNYQLVDYDGIQQLRKINRLWLLGNYATNASPFAQLDTIGELLQIENNAFLTDISAFQNLKDITGGRVWIRNNSNLSDCAAFAICKAIANTPLEVFISNNKTGCNSKEELADDCLNIFNFSAAKGKIYADLECNGLLDTTDALLPNHIIRLQDTQVPWASTGPDGTYANLLQPSASTRIVPDSIIGFSSQPAADTFVVNSGLQVFNDRDFRFCPDMSFHNLAVTVFPVRLPVRGFNQNYQVCVQNLGSNVENATLDFLLTDSTGQNNLQLVSAPGGVISPNGFQWELQSLKPFEKRCFNATIYIPPTAILGSVFGVKVRVTIEPATTETDTDDNVVELSQTIVGSFDPNDKTVSEEFLNHDETAAGNWLDYHIRFQNTGTFPATFVEVYDTLEADLDIRTLQLLAASHAYELSFPSPRVLKWRFDNIQLPDSTSDEANSHGFIAFRMKTMPNLAWGEMVTNRAGIYFDFNEVVLTNYAETSFYLVKTTEVEEAPFFEVYPNPVPEGAPIRLVLENDFYGSVKIELLGLDGRMLEVLEKEKTEDRQVFEITQLPSTNAFLVRVSDSRNSAVRLVGRF